MQRAAPTLQQWRRGMAGLVLGLMAGTAWAGPVAEVWKDPNCGCCTAWADHLKEAGFEVELHASQNMSEVKAEHGVPHRLASCHTAVVEGYVIEGHVPAADIQRLLDSEADVSGLAVPGMPHGSPGMETGRVDNYAVYAWQEDGDIDVYQRYTHDT